MDKELLRIVIIATGLIIIMCMLTWSYLKNKKSQENMDFYDDPELKDQNNTSLTIDDEVKDNEPMEAVDHHHYYDKEDSIYEPEEDDIEPPPRVSVPAIIQFSLIAKADEGFNGIDLVNAFGIVGLEYGNLKIYE
ncbi:MAG TPA: cell division protein, partial [Methylococcales bacterium]